MTLDCLTNPAVAAFPVLAATAWVKLTAQISLVVFVVFLVLLLANVLKSLV